MSKKRCLICKKKLSLAQSITCKCRCDNFYCSSHIQAEKHSCDFDYKEFGKVYLKSSLPLVEPDKLLRL